LAALQREHRGRREKKKLVSLSLSREVASPRSGGHKSNPPVSNPLERREEEDGGGGSGGAGLIRALLLRFAVSTLKCVISASSNPEARLNHGWVPCCRCLLPWSRGFPGSVRQNIEEHGW